MTWLFLIDCLFLISPHWIPTFFLLGFVIDKKISLWSIVTVSIFYDGILYSKYGLFFLLFLTFALLHKTFPKPKNPFLEFNLYQFLFFLFLCLITNTSLVLLGTEKVLTTLVLNNILLFLLIKTKPLT